MKNRILLFSFLTTLLLTLFPSCNFIGDIFRAGVWVGVIVVVAVIALIFFLIARLTRKR